MAPVADPEATRPPLWLLIGAAALGPSALNIFVPALPGLIAAFASDIATVNLALSLYLVTFALAQLVYGPISDRHGRRPTLLCGIALFGVATLLCAGALSLGMLIAGRILQAIGGCAGMRRFFSATIRPISATIARRSTACRRGARSSVSA